MSNSLENPWNEEHNRLNKHAVNIHKFGGSSLASAECVERAVSIIQQHCSLTDIIVVSANGDTTDGLIEIFKLAATKSEHVHEQISLVKAHQYQLIEALVSESSAKELIALLEQDISLILKWLQVDINAHYSELLALGEIWSARLLATILNEQVCPSKAVDARDFLRLSDESSCAVNYSLSQQLFEQVKPQRSLAVVTGFIARNEQNGPCTLGRNGSDYSATILAALTQAQQVTLWTDVDGIYSADPRVVPNARKLHRVPRAVAKELGRLGNPILHAKTLQPLDSNNCHLHIASSFDYQNAGTEVGDFGQIANQELAVTIENDLLLAQSESFIGDEGVAAAQELSALAVDGSKGQILIPISQQLSVSHWLASQATEVKFTSVSIIAVVGHQVTKRANVKLKLKHALKGQAVENVIASSNQHSYVAVLKQPCTGELLNHVHHELTKDARHIGLVIAGTGNIGKCFIDMLPKQLARIPALENVHLVGLLSSSKILLNEDGLNVEHVTDEFQSLAVNYDNDTLLQWISHHPYDDLVVVDITPSEQFSHLYHEFFAHGIHVIGANKWAASSGNDNYQQLKSSAAKNHSLWLGNTTVGAGLPINFAIEDLINSGDDIIEISGIFSGTLSWLFEKYTGEQSFSELVVQARELGITEPDPREDLSGRDVQRKLLILARAAGVELSLDDIECQNLVPEGLRELPLAAFLEQIHQLDDFFATHLAIAAEQQQCIRYVAKFTKRQGKITAQVGLVSLATDDAFSTLTPCDNIFKVKSLWYQDNPLIIRGPGAGREVTAGGLHSDLVNVCQQLASRGHQVKLKGINE